MEARASNAITFPSRSLGTSIFVFQKSKLLQKIRNAPSTVLGRIFLSSLPGEG
ncbi:hypothetical protein KsCSTR_18060 [Candidatus Kuenenia stuttgartiensis]|uniref:Uncharacterized protein n=1 Tax=Kuenenia stuttgartiensis TaxID=174633 RepID=Q1Q2B9_KUEST|nr:hypothetical protein KsCSTR_18060 [Candidatus Kuenenia stuttgartiensis]CAJ74155.1 unknown protein [Candidatus Kuenenia stuttgartiensis]